MDILSLLQNEYSQAMAWALLHSLWQGALILAMFYTILYFNVSKAHMRYNMAIIAIVCMISSFALTFTLYMKESSQEQAAFTGVLQYIFSQDKRGTSLGDWMERNAVFIQLCWFAGILLFCLRFLFGIAFLQYLKLLRVKIENVNILNVITHTCTKINITKKVSVFEHPMVRSPFTEGFFKPVIYLPLGFINAMSVHEVEAILAHELAHIKRNDFIVNVFVSIAETIFYYHPVMWWLASIVRAEREEASDDIALTVSGDRLIYAKALLKLKELENNGTPMLALGFSETKNKFLLNRIKHILNMPYTKSNFKEKLITLTLLVLCALVFTKSDLVAKEKNFNESLSEISITSKKDVSTDTLPKNMKKESYTVMRSNGKEDVELKMEDGKITQLKINGELIPEDKYDEHKKVIDGMKPSGKGPKAFYFGSDGMKEMDGFEFNFDALDDEHGTFAFDMPNMKAFKLNLDSLNTSFKDFRLNDSLFGLNLDSMQKHMALMFDGHKFGLGDNFEGGLQMFNLDDLGIEGFNFENFKGLDRLKDLNGLEGLEDFNLRENEEFGDMKSGKNLEDIIGKQLNKDGFLVPGKENKVELSGKNLKINGEKQPSNIHEKYKRLFEQETGLPLSKNSKLEFQVDGKEAKRKFKTF